ncbi:DUF2529 domain-containing protein [Bacillus sp. BRMEA1]|uniref:DUF2529 domain-containing protein n=1 Tax=Neobacillus endophyticus TaxID=2738405 RepID=UPI0015636D17|nr:DUF2529 domain-containing protein [Neobacillus endophyticus]NRD77208.1 DUF2529 domain-containing protein [Neobacillus endophyticus]
MLKMFTTQLMGLFKKISESEEFSFEDGARLLAQAPSGDGTIYIWGAREMKAVEFEAVEGAEPLKSAKELTAEKETLLTNTDRVLIFSRNAHDEAAVALAERLQEKFIPFVAVSTVLDSAAGGESELADVSAGSLPALADVHIDLQLTKGLLPDDEGNRYGYPSAMAGLFVYYGLKFTIEEILADYEDEE